MSERTPPIRNRGGPALAATLPGLPQTLAGRWGGGVTALASWLVGWSIVLLEWDRVRAAPGGAVDEQVALLTLVGMAVGVWVWSMRDLRREPPAREGVSQWTIAGRAFRKNRLAVLGLMAIYGLYMTALLTPFIAPHDPTFQNSPLTDRFTAPGAEFWLGTDQYHRDVFSRILYGARISLSIGFVAVGISVTIGTLVGATAGFLGGKFDSAIMRFVDMIISFPRLVLLIAIVALFEQSSIWIIIGVLGLTQWTGTARLVRGEVLSLREREFIQAARALGYSKRRIILKHVVPNTMAPVIVAATLGIGNVIVLEAGLSFLGLGLQPPTPSWGSMVSDGRDQIIAGDWWLSTYAGLAIVLTVVCFNLVGDGLRDALDPRLRT